MNNYNTLITQLMRATHEQEKFNNLEAFVFFILQATIYDIISAEEAEELLEIDEQAVYNDLLDFICNKYLESSYIEREYDNKYIAIKSEDEQLALLQLLNYHGYRWSRGEELMSKDFFQGFDFIDIAFRPVVRDGAKRVLVGTVQTLEDQSLDYSYFEEKLHV